MLDSSKILPLTAIDPNTNNKSLVMFKVSEECKEYQY